MPRLPRTPTDLVRLADWLEVSALASPGRTASSVDLEGALDEGSLLEPQAPEEPEASEALETVVVDVFYELEQRALAAGPAYPFLVDIPVLRARRNWRARSSYVFCLCLSYFGVTRRNGASVYPRRIFEALCVDAARSYLRGEAIRFASPRTSDTVPKSFVAAIDQLCRGHIGEGEGFRKQPVLSGKDRGLDVVAWRDAPDALPGKLILFGNSASGWNWESKLDELQPLNFCADWMVEVPVSPLLKAFFMPHRMDRRYWDRNTRRAGIIFDRCRISALVPRLPVTERLGDGLAWTRSRLATVTT